MRLFIAEKPSLGRAIAQGLGVVKNDRNIIYCKNDTVIACCAGHMLELAEPDEYLPDDLPKNKKGSKIWRMQDLPIVPRIWKKHPISDKRGSLSEIKKLLVMAKDVVVAGDPDREGQLLVEEVLKFYGWKGPTYRYWSNGTDIASVKKALTTLHPNSKYHGLGLAAEARSRADWLVGMNLTRATTLSSGHMVSVGRVQTPVLRLIADRDSAIRNFKPRDFFNVEMSFKAERGTYTAKWKIPDELKDPEGYLTDKTKAQACIERTQGRDGRIIASEQKLKHQEPPIPYDLNELQKECGRRYGYSPKKTLETAQALYEQYHLTTYPRTSCGYLPESQQGDVPTILDNLKKAWPAFSQAIAKTDPKRKSPVWNDKKVAEEAHTGLIPTLKGATPDEIAKLPEECRRVYELVSRRYIQVFMPDHSYYETTLETKVNDDIFTAKGRRTVDPGFKAFTDAGAQKDANDDDQEVPFLEKGSSAIALKGELKGGVTKPPAPFTQVSIIDAMQNVWKYVEDKRDKALLKESKGIGTVATRADILDTLKKRGLMEVKGRKCELHATPAGLEALKIIPGELQSAVLTARTEDDMQRIQQGAKDLAAFVGEQEDFVTRLIKEITKMAEEAHKDDPKCPDCGGPIRRFESKYRKGEFTWVCSKCAKRFRDDGGKPGEEIKASAKPKFKCPKCGQMTVIECVSKKDGSHYGWCTNDKCGAHFDWVDGKPVPQKPKEPRIKCPKCGKITLGKFTSKKTGKPYWYCTNKSCGAHFSDDNGKPGNEWGNK